METFSQHNELSVFLWCPEKIFSCSDDKVARWEKFSCDFSNRHKPMFVRRPWKGGIWQSFCVCHGFDGRADFLSHICEPSDVLTANGVYARSEIFIHLWGDLALRHEVTKTKTLSHSCPLSWKTWWGQRGELPGRRSVSEQLSPLLSSLCSYKKKIAENQTVKLGRRMSPPPSPSFLRLGRETWFTFRLAYRGVTWHNGGLHNTSFTQRSASAQRARWESIMLHVNPELRLRPINYWQRRKTMKHLRKHESRRNNQSSSSASHLCFLNQRQNCQMIVLFIQSEGDVFVSLLPENMLAVLLNIRMTWKKRMMLS